jgi:hypothetical protein
VAVYLERPHVAKDKAILYEARSARWWLKVKRKGWTVGEDRWQRDVVVIYERREIWRSLTATGQ